ncbi:MAG TPA: tetratricopeptide repeat protein [Terracidiphilus sp.]|nr:tetratricopeptide repeat protein [Terracidiphilus sp.]
MSTSIKTLAIVALVVIAGSLVAGAQDPKLKLTIPLRSRLSPVQRLNRDGVEAIQHHQYDKAEGFFMKAYLYDPGDPFTLNNLGYISEMQGELDRAQKFYRLALEQGSNADIDISSQKELKGKPMLAAVQGLQDTPMRINRMNVAAVKLLSQNRGFDAVRLLKDTLRLDPQNPFTLNNLGVASEAIGDFNGALRYYAAAAAQNSKEPVAVALDASWRGRPVSEAAGESAKRLERRMRKMGGNDTQAAMLNTRGVFEANENDWVAAKDDFLRAYSLDPTSAFSLNNRGYVAEKDGDLETAQFFYMKARQAEGANALVGLATQQSAQGQSLSHVSNDSTYKVEGALDVYSQQRRRQTGPIELVPRGAASQSNPPAQPNGHSSTNPPATTTAPSPQNTH